MTRKEISPLKTLLAVSLAAGLIACSEKAEQPADTGMTADAEEPTLEAPLTVVDANPFFSEWDTPYGIPPFAEIHNAHYKPAFERGIEQQRADIAAIRDNPEDSTFENTIEALELAGASLNVVKHVFNNITNTDTNDVLQELEVEISSILTRESDAIYLDDKIYTRVKAVYDARETLGLDEQAMRLVELKHRDFVRKGAALNAVQIAETVLGVPMRVS